MQEARGKTSSMGSAAPTIPGGRRVVLFSSIQEIDNMLHIYVWNPRLGAWGHCAMHVHRRDPAQSRYVSWWPGDPSNVNTVEANDGVARLPSYDLRLEGRKPDHEFIINAGHEYLCEIAIIQAWDTWKRNAVYYTLTRNCATTVAQLLKGPGGGDKFVLWEPLLWWGPGDMVGYMTVINYQFPVLRPLTPTVSPEITRMAYAETDSRMA